MGRWRLRSPQLRAQSSPRDREDLADLWNSPARNWIWRISEALADQIGQAINLIKFGNTGPADQFIHTDISIGLNGFFHR